MNNQGLLEANPHMNQHPPVETERYLTAIRELHDQIREWVKDTDLIERESIMRLSEEERGTFDAPCLSLGRPSGSTLITIEPIGSLIIGALGRVDFVGDVGSEVVLLLQEGGGALTRELGFGGSKSARTSPLFRGVYRDGWYWLPDQRRDEARFLDAATFWELVAQVSDYEP